MDDRLRCATDRISARDEDSVSHSGWTPNLRHLRATSLIVHGASVREAARQLHISQPSLTQAIRKLERQFGAAIFDRAGGRLLATGDGYALGRRIDRCLHFIRQGLEQTLLPMAGPPTDESEAIQKLRDIQIGQISRRLTIPKIRVLLAVDACDSIEAAADRLSLRPSSVRRTLLDLCKILGSAAAPPWLNENGPAAAPAHLLADHFRLALEELELARPSSGVEGGALCPAISIGTVPAATGTLLPNVVRRVVEETPGVRLKVVSREYTHMLEDVRAGRLDFLCSTTRPPLPADLDGRLLFYTELRIVARRGHPLAGRREKIGGEELARYPWVVPDVATGAGERFRRLFHEEGIAPPAGLMQTRVSDMVYNLLRQSDFLALVSCLPQASGEVGEGLVALNRLPPDYRRPIWLLWRRNVRPGEAQSKLLNFVLEEAELLAARKPGPAASRSTDASGLTSAAKSLSSAVP